MEKSVNTLSATVAATQQHHNTCDMCKNQPPSTSNPLQSSLHCTCDSSCSLLFYSALYWSGAEGYFFQGGLFEAFLATLNGTMVPAYRADSCFIEPVYNVW